MTDKSPNYIATRADQEFLETARPRSPKFPSIGEALERRRQLRETIAARAMLIFAGLGLLYAFFWSSFGWVIFGFNLVGFIITCFITGNRQWRNAGSPGGVNGRRPF